jgi:hypothetical protein
MPVHLLSALLLLVSAPAPRTPVYVTASFQDRNGLFMETLAESEIQISENGQSRKLEFMARDTIPAIYGILIERALIPASGIPERGAFGSVPGIAAVQDMAYEMIDKQLGRQAVWVGVYDRELEVALEPSTDPFMAKNAIQQIRGTRRTEDSFLYAALFSSVQKMNERSEKRRVLIVFLGMLDMGTSGKLKQLKNLLSSSNVELFLVSLAPKTSSPGGYSPVLSQAALKDLATVTCGDVFFTADNRDHLDDITRRMMNQIRTFYTFGFESQSTVETPARLSIRCTLPSTKVKHHPTVPVLQ